MPKSNKAIKFEPYACPYYIYKYATEASSGILIIRYDHNVYIYIAESTDRYMMRQKRDKTKLNTRFIHI